MMQHLLLSASILAVLVGCQTTSDTVRFPAPAWATNSPAAITARVFRLIGEGPFPAVIVLHGCGGVDGHHTGWAETLVSWGYVAMVVDSFGARGFQSVCTSVSAVTPRTRGYDIAGASEYLQSQPYVLKGELGLIGFSHGGWTIMKAVQSNNKLENQGVKAAIAYYPYCDPVDDVDVDLPLLVLIGAEDDWTPADRCRRLQASPALRNASQVEMIFYPGAYHAFDRPIPVQDMLGQGEGGTTATRRIGYNPSAARDAVRQTEDFLKKHLKSPP